MQKKIFDLYIELMEFISAMMGMDVEIILYEVETEKVYKVINPMDDEMKPGSDMRSLEKSFIANKLYENEKYIVNYRALSKSKKKLKSGTFFMKDTENQLLAIMTVNIPVDHLVELRDMLNTLISGPETIRKGNAGEFYDSFDLTVGDMVQNTINEEVAKFGVAATRLSHQEKMDLIRILDNKGIFLVKGAISELAKTMETTETTIYRYISKMNSMSEDES